jgi:hypothetical protein
MKILISRIFPLQAFEDTGFTAVFVDELDAGGFCPHCIARRARFVPGPRHASKHKHL